MRQMWRLLIFILLAWAQVPGKLSGQGTLTLAVRCEDCGRDLPAGAYPDSTALSEALAAWQADQQAAARWAASVDTLRRLSPSVFLAVLHRGPAYAWGELRPPADPRSAAWLRKAGYRPRRYADRPLDPNAWFALRDSTLGRAADAGYPFAAVGLTDLAPTAEGQLSATVVVTPGPRISVGEVRAPEGARIRPVFLQRYLGLLPGEAYRSSRVRRIANRLRQLPYVTVQGEPRISFQDSLAYFDLPLRPRPASRFDFVIGVLPNAGTDDRLLLTADLNGELRNGFGQGERIAVRFEQLRPATQELALGLEYPFVFGLPFGVEGDLDLYRRDSSFLNVNWRLAATYLREGNDQLSFFWENRRSIIPGEDGPVDPATVSTTDTLGVVRSFFGLRARRVRTDRRFSPRSGYAFDLSLAAGLRRLPGVVTEDDENERSAQGQVNLSADLYLDPLAGTVIYLGVKGAGLFSGSPVLANEQYRIGGSNLLRGFNEQSIFARSYAVLTAEFRLLLGGNAYLYAFGDFARVDRRSQAKPDLPTDYPVGFGAGINFDTRAGIFGLSLALGRDNLNPTIDLGAPKVHLGYVSVF